MTTPSAGGAAASLKAVLDR
ncbi:hypothetical protein A2U01_0056729, partial [Trifolium medium]|nr:hypothetical protein [Trifolium medium]